MFEKAVKTQSRLRLALSGPSGSGKTYTSLMLAKHLGKKTAVVDTEHGSASKYADLFEFDVCELSSFHPQQYISAIDAASSGGYEILIIDSLSHAWNGVDGALDLVDQAASRQRTKNTFTAWKTVTPLQNRLVETILTSPCHVIATMRAKTDYIMQNQNGKQVPVKVGMAPIQRDGIEYEFDMVGEMAIDNSLVFTKSRCSQLSGASFEKPGKELAEALSTWLTGGAVAEFKESRTALMKRTLKPIELLGWTKADGEAFLQKTYGVSTRKQLTDGNLADFVERLESLVENSNF